MIIISRLIFKVQSEIYQSEDYKTNLKSKLSWTVKKQWRTFLREGVQLEKQFFSLIKQISTKEESEDFMRDFFQTLKGWLRVFGWSKNLNRAEFAPCESQERDFCEKHSNSVSKQAFRSAL